MQNVKKSDAAWERFRARTASGKSARRGFNPRAYHIRKGGRR